MLLFQLTPLFEQLNNKSICFIATVTVNNILG